MKDDLFRGLDAIDWDNLTHAYGSAKDIPQLLRDLVSDDDEVSKQASYDSFGNIWHQGTIYEATTYAVPFLIKIVHQTQSLQRPHILMLLGEIATGYGQDKAIEAVRDGILIYLELLTDEDTVVRGEVGGLLSKLPLDVAQSIHPLENAIREEVVVSTKVSLIDSLAQLIDKSNYDINLDQYLTYFSELVRDSVPSVQLASAMSLARLDGSNLDVKAIDIFMDGLAHPEKYSIQPETTSARNYEAVEWLIYLIELLTRFDSRMMLSQIDNLLSEIDSKKSLLVRRQMHREIAEQMIISTFGIDVLKHYSWASSQGHRTYYVLRKGDALSLSTPTWLKLNLLQHNTLKIIAKHDVFWDYETNLLAIHGLPQKREDLRKFLKSVNSVDSDL